MMNKNEKRNLARKNAEAKKAQRKNERSANAKNAMGVNTGKKGKSLVPQSKAKKK